jgi:hypothetical protein
VKPITHHSDSDRMGAFKRRSARRYDRSNPTYCGAITCIAALLNWNATIDSNRAPTLCGFI